MKVLNSQVNRTAQGQLYAFTQGLDVDCQLYRQEIRVQRAWARALHEAGHLSAADMILLGEGLDEALAKIEDGSFIWREEDEDIHMNLERFLTDTRGEVGKRVHYGRSRNDLIATTLRLFVADCLEQQSAGICALGESLKGKAREWLSILVPGLTHLQSGQPIRLGHMLSAHAWALHRDVQRLRQARANAMAVCPLGAAAFAGTHITLNLLSLSEELGFASPLLHSYDAVGDRDFILEALNNFSIVAVHLSRLSEELMFWSSSAVGLIGLPQEYSTGSSIMPNKRNPDVLELARAKMARVMAGAQEGAILVRAVTPSYGSDLHELKRTFVLAAQELAAVIGILKPFCEGLTVRPAVAENLLMKGHILATEIANELSASGVPFREAYAQAAERVILAEQRGCQIHEVTDGAASEENPFEAAVERRCLMGGTARAAAEESLNRLNFRES